MSQDPVCGTTVKPESPHQSILDRVPYRFCDAKCKTKFDADPARYFLGADHLHRIQAKAQAIVGAALTVPAQERR